MKTEAFEAMEAQEIVRALAAVAAADGAIVAREVAFLDGFADPYGLNASAWFATPLDEAALARAITTREKRRAVLVLCLRMAVCDKKYTPEEESTITRIAAALEIPTGDLAELAREAGL